MRWNFLNLTDWFSWGAPHFYSTLKNPEACHHGWRLGFPIVTRTKNVKLLVWKYCGFQTKEQQGGAHHVQYLQGDLQKRLFHHLSRRKIFKDKYVSYLWWNKNICITTIFPHDCVFKGLGKNYSTCSKRGIKPCVAPEEAARNLIN